MHLMKKKAGKSDARSGMKMIGGVAAGAAAGSLLGPVGAAVGAIAGGVAGANADEIVASKPARQLAKATKQGVSKMMNSRAAKSAAKKVGATSLVKKKAPGKKKAGARKKKGAGPKVAKKKVAVKKKR